MCINVPFIKVCSNLVHLTSFCGHFEKRKKETRNLTKDIRNLETPAWLNKDRIKHLYTLVSNFKHFLWLKPAHMYIHYRLWGGNPLSSLNRWSSGCSSLSCELDVFHSLGFCWSFYINTGCYDHQLVSGLISNLLQLTFAAPQGATGLVWYGMGGG